MDIIEFLKNLHDDCLRLLPHISFDKEHKLHFTLLSLYSSMIELVGCMLILMDNNGRIGVLSIFRTFLETYVEFYNLAQDPRYGYYMDANDEKEWLKVLKAARENKNPYLSEISLLTNLPEIISEKEGKLNDLKKCGFSTLTIRERFKKANMLDEYESLYNSLCTEAHSNKRALIDRHAEIGKDDYKLVIYKNSPDAKYLFYLDSAAYFLISATVNIHQKFESDAVKEVISFHKALDTIRKSYDLKGMWNASKYQS